MAVRTTIERILRDDDDDSGQTVRYWRIEVEGRHLSIMRDRESGSQQVMLIRASDVETFVRDLMKAAEFADAYNPAETPIDG
jgi:hypothetical protein